MVDTDWDRTFLDASSKLAELPCEAFHLVRYRLVAPLDPQKFENLATRTQEVAFRSLIILGIALAAWASIAMSVLLLGAALYGVAIKVLRAIGFALQKEGFTHIRTAVPEVRLGAGPVSIKVMTFNLCGVGGGMSLDHGGVISWKERFEQFAQMIEREKPNVLFLQEVYDTALAEKFIKRFEKLYPHLFAHLGPNVIGSVGGGMCFTDLANTFSHTCFSNNSWDLARGFGTLMVKANPEDASPALCIIGTHLIHNSAPKRAEQFNQIRANVPAGVPTVLVGDLNIECNGPEGEILKPYLDHGYQGNEPTCTNRLCAQWDKEARSVWDEKIDYISLFRTDQARIEGCRLIKTFDATYNTKTAVSDHHAMIANVRVRS